MSKIPEFAEAVKKFSKFLGSKGYPRELSWIFREDFYAPGINRYLVVEPRPDENRALAEVYYAKVRGTGSILLRGMFRMGDTTAATVWTPTEVSQNVEPGLKLTAAEPFLEAKTVESKFSWWLNRLSPAYRYNLKHSFDVPLRSGILGL